MKRKDKLPDADLEILNEFLEVEQSENTSFQELSKRKHQHSADSPEDKDDDDDEKSPATPERKQTDKQLRVAPGSECIALVIQKLIIFYDYVKYLIDQNRPYDKTSFFVRYQNSIAIELKGLTDALKISAERVQKAENQFEKLHLVAKKQHDKFFEAESNQSKKIMQLQEGWKKLTAIFNFKTEGVGAGVPKTEEKNSPTPSSADLCKIVLKREADAEHQLRAAIVQSHKEQSYLRLISKISDINPRGPWQKQMRNFAEAMSEFSRSKDKTQVTLTTSESKFILSSRHELMTQMQESIGDDNTDFLKPYHAEMLIRHDFASPALYGPEFLESDWQAYGKIFNIMLEKLQYAWSVHAEREDKLTADMRATLMSKEIKDRSKMSTVLSTLESDAKALIEDISGITNLGVISVYDRTIEKLKDFQRKLQSAQKSQKNNIKSYQDLWETTLEVLLKNLQTYQDSKNSKDHDAGEAVRDLNKAEYEIISALINRLSIYSNIFEMRHAEFVNYRKGSVVDDKSWPELFRGIAFDARKLLNDKKNNLASFKESFNSLRTRMLSLNQHFLSSKSYQSLQSQMMALDELEQQSGKESQKLLEEYQQELKNIENSYQRNLENAYRQLDQRLGWREYNRANSRALLLGKPLSDWEEKSNLRENDRLTVLKECKEKIEKQKAAAHSEYKDNLNKLQIRKEKAEKIAIKKKLQVLIDCMDSYQPTVCSGPLSALCDFSE